MTESARTALVTGGGSGIGKATCLRQARDGRAVGVLDVNGEAAAAVAREIEDAGGKSVAVEADVADRAQVDAATAKIREELGPVTILVNCAGIDSFAPVEDISDSDLDRLMGVNLKGNFLLVGAVLADMVDAGWGRIVNIAALGAQTGAPAVSLYTATKGGVISMTRSLAAELGPKGITVNAVSPGIIDTPMVRNAMAGDYGQELFDRLVASYPIARLGKPEDIAAACAFFASEEAGYITGQTLGVNGGAAV